MSHVLIIEDEPFTAFSMELALEDAGATSFDTVDNEDDAVAAARKRRPDVIISDVALKEGTGPAAVETIHREIGAMPVVFVTGTPEDCPKYDGIGTVLPKPFDQHMLTDAYRKARASRPDPRTLERN